MYKKDLIIFSNIRQIKEYLSSLDEGFFPNVISIDDFFNDFCLHKNAKASEIQRIIAMNKACLKTKNYHKLNFSNDFLSFLENKEYLFSFFSELASQKVSIDELRKQDLYSFFDEYLDILEECLKHYKNELKELNLVDEITQENLEMNEFLLDQYKNITLYLNGFLKKYESEFLEQISAKIKLKIIVNISIYNAKLLAKTFSIDFEPNHTYTIVFKDSWLVEQKQALHFNDTLKTAAFQNSVHQYIFALNLISQHYENDKKIALIMPDESVANEIKSLDFHNYLNIAAGLNSNEISQKINAILNDDEYCFSMGKIQEKLLKTQNISLDFSNLDELKKQFLSLSDNDEIKEILKDRLNDIKAINQEFKLEPVQILKLLDLENIKISHTDGGDVSAIGLLESRGMKYDLVIVCDFNDDLVPKRSINEMFLNNAVRTKAGLISYQDRENLQRHYYKELFNAKEVYVLYLQNEEKSPARFLQDYKQIPLNIDTDDLIKSFIKPDNKEIKANEEILKIDENKLKTHDFFAQELSFSRLSTYLNSGYEYYLKYIENIDEPSSLSSVNQMILGTKVHKFLEKHNFSSLEKLRNDFKKEFLGILNPIDFALIYDNLEPAFYLIKEFDDNFKNEAKINGKIGNINAIGFADKISDTCLIDYKITAKPSDQSKHERQLAFYNLLLNKDLKSFILYLKSTKGTVYEATKLDKHKQDLETELAQIKTEGIKMQNPDKAYGYYHLIINKKDRL